MSSRTRTGPYNNDTFVSLNKLAVSGAKIGLQHLFADLHFRGRAVADLLSEMHHNDVAADLHDQVHVVLDNEYGCAARLWSTRSGKVPWRDIGADDGRRRAGAPAAPGDFASVW